jgi:hypothetical protein
MEIFTSPVSVNLAANFIEKVTSQDERQMLLAMTFGVRATKTVPNLSS